ncbi:MAG: response regulator [Calditrichia bacterium]
MKKILLAEDDRNLSRSVDILLTLDGFEVISVYNGEEALTKLCQQKYDLLITDIVMPHLNGFELVTKIKKVNPKIPIMVVSGKLNDSLIDDLHEVGVEYVLPKPINPSRFRKMVQKIFDKQSQKVG